MFEKIHECRGITLFDKVVNQIVVHIDDDISGFDELNLAGINETDNEPYYIFFLCSLSISLQY